MVRGPKKHLKRLAAPKHWMLAKLGGIFAPRPSQGPHKLRECLPLVILLRNRLKYALTRKEVLYILKQRVVKVDHRVRTDVTYPSGFMDVITIDRIKQNFRLLYDTKGRFTAHKISEEEGAYKLCKVRRTKICEGGIPYVYTTDSRSIRFPHPDIKRFDTIKFDLKTNKITDFYKFESGNVAMVTAGYNIGRVGTISHRERHPGSYDIVYLKDAIGKSFATRIENVFVLGKGHSPAISLPKGRGIRKTIIEERALRVKKGASAPVQQPKVKKGKKSKQ